MGMNKDHWNKVAEANDHPWSGVPEWLPELIAKYEPSPRRGLDLGTGNGDKAIWLANQGFELTGIDISDKAIEAAREKATAVAKQPQFVVADIKDLASLGFGDGRFGLILDLLSSQFLPKQHQQAHFRTVHELVHPKGVFVYARVDSIGDGAPEWVRELSMIEKEFTDLLSGFEVLERKKRPSENLTDTELTRLVLKQP